MLITSSMAQNIISISGLILIFLVVVFIAVFLLWIILSLLKASINQTIKICGYVNILYYRYRYGNFKATMYMFAFSRLHMKQFMRKKTNKISRYASDNGRATVLLNCASMIHSFDTKDQEKIMAHYERIKRSKANLLNSNSRRTE